MANTRSSTGAVARKNYKINFKNFNVLIELLITYTSIFSSMYVHKI